MISWNQSEIKEAVREDVDWMELAQGNSQCPSLVKTVI